VFNLNPSKHQKAAVLKSKSILWIYAKPRLESLFSQNDSTRVTINDSMLESESFLQNLWVSDGQTQFVCTQRNEHFCFSNNQDWCKCFV